MNIAGLDLNLLVVFRAVYARRNISRAAQTLGKSQPAVSNALSRLRLLCNDHLFVPVSGGVRPTQFAERLAPKVNDALRLIEESLAEGHAFAPALSQKVFRVNMSDYVQAILLARLMGWLKEFAPAIRIEVSSLRPSELPQAWEAGEIDLVIECHEVKGGRLRRQKLYEDEFVCLLREDHPEVGDGLTRRQFLELRHAAVRVSAFRGLIDASLARQGLKRPSVLDVPHCMVAPFVVARTDLIVVLPRRQAEDFVPLLPVKILPCPIPLPRFSTSQYWSADVHDDEAHRWLRGAVKELCRGL